MDQKLTFLLIQHMEEIGQHLFDLSQKDNFKIGYQRDELVTPRVTYFTKRELALGIVNLDDFEAMTPLYEDKKFITKSLLDNGLSLNDHFFRF